MPNKEQTINDHRERLIRVLVHIQERADGPLSLERLAGVARFSPFHFHRVFAAYVGETLHEYLRRIRLDKAAFRLHYSDDPVTDIALSAGYETPTAFTKAFKRRFGKNPTEYKRIRREKLPAVVDIPAMKAPGRKVMNMKPAIRTMTGQKVLFVRKTGQYARAAGEAWATLMKFAYSHGLMNRETKAIGISHDSPEITPEEQIRYDACITFRGPVKPEGEVGVQTIAGGRYAVFLHRGPYSAFHETYAHIMTRWYPESGETFRDLPCFELYMNRDPRRTKPENLKTEIYVPIR